MERVTELLIESTNSIISEFAYVQYCVEKETINQRQTYLESPYR